MPFTNKDFERVYPKLRNYAFYLTKNNFDEAEDLLQETFLKMLEKIRLFDDREKNTHSIEKWGSAIMHNLFIDKKRFVKRFTVSSIEDVKIPDKILKEESFKDHNDVLVRKKCREIKTLLKKEIAGQKHLSKNITKEYLSIFILRSFGLSYAEISDHLNLNIGTLKSRMFHMKQDIGEMINSG